MENAGVEIEQPFCTDERLSTEWIHANEVTTLQGTNCTIINVT